MKVPSILIVACCLHLVSATFKLQFTKPGGLTERDTVSATFKHPYGSYTAKLKIGSNGEEVDVMVDTGSSDLLIPESFSIPCFDDPDCTPGGGFSTTASDSFQVNDTDHKFTAVNGTVLDTVWGMDKVQFGNITIDQLSFSVFEATNPTAGTLGLGLPELEATNFKNSTPGPYTPYTYENFPQKLISEGIIERNMYSVYLSNSEYGEGTILFGGLDRAKIDGKLLVKPLAFTDETERFDEPIRLAIELNTIDIMNGSDTNSISLFSVGTTLETAMEHSYFPSEYIEKLVEEIPSAQLNSLYKFYEIDCEESGYNILFGFDTMSINVPIEEFVTEGILFPDACLLGLLPSDEDFFRLGGNFLTHAYVAFDLEGRSIGIAPLITTTEEDIEELPDGLLRSVSSDETTTGEESETTGDESSETSTGNGNDENDDEDETTADGSAALLPSRFWVFVFVASSLALQG